MRILLLDPQYEAFLAEHYARRPELADAPYDVQWRALMDTFFSKADSYSHHLQALGHAAHEVVFNCVPLQRAWAREHGLREGGRRRARSRAALERIVAAQVEEFRPDVVYVQNISVLRGRFLRELGAGRLLAGQIASEAPAERQLRRFDLLVTSFPHYVGRFRAVGVASEYLPLAFDPRVLERLEPGPRDLGVVFAGSLGRGQHVAGNALLERVADRLELEVYGKDVDDWPPEAALRRRFRGTAWGLDMLRLFGRARIVLNRHIDVAEGYANNMRLFEATGTGALLLTDDKVNLHELFEPGREVVVYRDEAELVDLATRYLAREEERAEIAAAGQRRTLAEHTYRRRMAELARILERYSR